VNVRLDLRTIQVPDFVETIENLTQATNNLEAPGLSNSWDDLKAADGFLARTGLSLPSEAQWEYACRAGLSLPISGTGNLDEMVWYEANSGGTTHPVGEKLPNQFGLHDMHGNVVEWCEDVYSDGFYGSPEAAGPDPVSDSGPDEFRIVRGGSWFSLARHCRSAFRDFRPPDYRTSDDGFRPLRPLP